MHPRKGKRLGENPRWTLLLVRGSAGDVWRLSLPHGLVRVAALAAALLAGAGIFLTGSCLLMARDQRELWQLRLARRSEEAQMRQIRARSQEVEARLNSIQDLDQRVRQLTGEASNAGRPAAPAGKPAPGGQGGPHIALPVRSQMALLAGDLARKEQDLSDAEGLLRRRLETLCAVPSTPPVPGHSTSEFGARRSPFGRRQEFHDGLDLDAPYGAPVHAAAAGVVVSAERDGAYGNVVTLRHGHGFVSRYGHLSAFAVTPGQHVQRGDVLGRVGSTGRSTGPHLHFMVLRAGEAENPREFLVRQP